MPFEAVPSIDWDDPNLRFIDLTGDGLAAKYRGPAGDRALRVRSCATLGEAVLYTTSPRLMNAADRAAFAKVEEAVLQQ